MSQAAGPGDDNNLWILREDLQAKRSFIHFAKNRLRQASGDPHYLIISLLCCEDEGTVI